MSEIGTIVRRWRRRSGDRSSTDTATTSVRCLSEHVGELMDLEVTRLGRPSCRVRARVLTVDLTSPPGTITFEIPDKTRALLTLGEGVHVVSLADVNGLANGS